MLVTPLSLTLPCVQVSPDTWNSTNILTVPILTSSIATGSAYILTYSLAIGSGQQVFRSALTLKSLLAVLAILTHINF
jgi:hypothetical protein